ncbi:MAG: alpha-ketoacid dehydrogenase subunit beta [Candidatus Marinimicrobia bacterium]|nr:alpha-ketoacid dehydrogenase subunit beta [Candidatus Neomarinimicrobiota bacterium]MCF7828403.1 alpha-ketoacid dehydrogenase subunit beta [Candidatus Neomarinimicrobiota bacterium]MCF7881003.1 alpha-ketoacid dehydrogenase subunit beta [Candidatus Neomarinimicrobiota bacterium]
MPEITYIQAISDGLREEMRRDDSVFLIGEDIGEYGGAFKVTEGFLDEFGEERVIDTPIAETAILGMSIGAALQGLRPVAEMQFSDFVANGFNQLVNNAAKIHYRWGGHVPMVVRMPTGGGIHGGPFHSQNTEAWFFHVPGLKLVAPSTPYDAKGLIKAAIRDENPVLYFEHKYLYRREKGEVPEGDYEVEIGKGRIAREGKDITVLTYGSMVSASLEAVENLKGDIDVEVIDLRTLIPLDMELIIESIKKTNKVLIVHEDVRTGGIGAELSARITEEAFEWLDGPIRRIASIDTPVPFAPSLEEYFMPNPEKIADGIQQLWNY